MSALYGDIMRPSA